MVDLHARLSLRATGVPDEVFESPICGGALEGGWYLVIGNRCDHRVIAPSLLEVISQAHDLVACSVEEHVMFSSAAGWRNGECEWSIVHDASNGIADLQATGEPPSSYETYKTERLAEQEANGGESSDVDYVFEIPLDVARDLTGFKHDEDTDSLFVEPLEVLEDARPRPWWRFWS